ncbi:hypothetical protein CPB85DRAFT_1257477 [Mucidula mucida]|nr:hypothetical protein CPB85DRAFT_1257477 [Mucidula mucida]
MGTTAVGPRTKKGFAGISIALLNPNSKRPFRIRDKPAAYTFSRDRQAVLLPSPLLFSPRMSQFPYRTQGTHRGDGSGGLKVPQIMQKLIDQPANSLRLACKDIQRLYVNVAWILLLLGNAEDVIKAPDLEGTETPYTSGYTTLVMAGAQRISPIYGGDSSNLPHFDTFKYLLKCGAPVDLPDIVGYTVLIHGTMHWMLKRTGDSKPMYNDACDHCSKRDTSLKICGQCHTVLQIALAYTQAKLPQGYHDDAQAFLRRAPHQHLPTAKFSRDVMDIPAADTADTPAAHHRARIENNMLHILHMPSDIGGSNEDSVLLPTEKEDASAREKLSAIDKKIRKTSIYGTVTIVPIDYLDHIMSGARTVVFKLNNWNL